MRFCERDGVPKQYVEEHEPEIEVFDLTAESRTADPETVARAWMRSETLAAALPLTERLYSVALFRVGPRRVLWYQSCHHIAVDGYGGSLISTRAAQIYTALRAGRDPSAEAYEPVWRAAWTPDRAYHPAQPSAPPTARTGARPWPTCVRGWPPSCSIRPGRRSRRCRRSATVIRAG